MSLDLGMPRDGRLMYSSPYLHLFFVVSLSLPPFFSPSFSRVAVPSPARTV